jgi:DnaJ-class molecular chaperone
MKRIAEYRKLLGATKTTELSELKTIYRNFMKECHPDKFHDNEVAKLEAEEKSKKVIEAYHFLVSIAPETMERNAEEYNQTTATTIVDFQYKGQTLEIMFADGSTYEYFGVPKPIFQKLVNADSQGRMARRMIYNSFVYRKKVSQA